MDKSPPSVLIDRLIARVGDWRGERLAQIRRVMLSADREIVEEFKWMGTPTWSHFGIVAIANPHTGKVKVTFPHGAHLPDPRKLFNAGLGGKEWRAIDLFETDVVDEKALGELIRAAVSYNRAEVTDRPAPKGRPNAPRRGSSRRKPS